MKMRNPRHAVGMSKIEKLEDRRMLAAGDLDKSFSGDGKATINVGGTTIMTAADVAVQADGKTVVVGQVRLSPSSQTFRVAVARFNLDGTPDTTFGTAGTGIVQTNIGDANDDRGRCVAIQGDGKIVVGAFSTTDGLFGQTVRFGVARFNTNGTLDKTFDGDGKRVIDFNGFPGDILLQSVNTTNGIVQKILIVGSQDNGILNPNDNFAVARLNPDGKLDGTFSGDGKEDYNLGSSKEMANAAAIDSQGRIVLAGHSGSPSAAKVGIVRINKTTGARDATFGTGGHIVTAIPGSATSMASGVVIQSGDKIVVAGQTGTGTGRNFLLARYLSNGQLDKTFGGNGTGFVQTDFGASDTAADLIPSADGGLIVAGLSGQKLAMASYTADGVLRTSFGTGGKLITEFSGAGTFGEAGIAKGPGRRFVTAGGTLFKTARFLDAGANVVAAGTFQPNTFEQGARSTGFLVTRSERLSVPTRVFFTIGGTATIGKFALPNQPNPNDYTLTGMTVPIAVIGGGDRTPYVDIPAGQTFVNVTLTPVDDTRVEGNETAIFTILPNASYDIGTNSGTKITIFDNDGTLLNATADAYVRDGTSAGTNFGAAPQLEVKKASSGFNRQTYLKFHIDTLSTINSAKLRLFGRLTAADGAGIATSVFGSNVTNWSESALNFNNKPAITGSALATTTITDTTARFYEWDITAFLKAQKAAGKTVVTLVLTNLVNSSQFVTFNSREAGNGPQIIVG